MIGEVAMVARERVCVAMMPTLGQVAQYVAMVAPQLVLESKPVLTSWTTLPLSQWMVSEILKVVREEWHAHLL
jgi:hypothetical protein